MRLNKRASILAVTGLLMAIGTAHAQDSTTGAVRGGVKDQASGEPVIGATVVASGPALQGTQATITDEGGQYFIANLPPGVYQVVVYYADAQFSRTNVLVQLGKVGVVNININTQAAAGETIVIEGRAPIIDQQSTKTGQTITSDYTRNVPTGRTFGEVLGAAAGQSGDFYGSSFSGSSSLENTYIVEGVNTTDPGYGKLTTNLPNEFIQETEIITGGYNAEYGRSTGGIINVITKSGSNEFHGSVFSYWTPGALVAEAKDTAVASSSIARQDDLANSFDVGAEVGGPIIRDKLWFHAGINPSFTYTDVTRTVQTQIDEDGDGVPDQDENGFAILEPLDSTVRQEKTQRYYYSGKLTGAVTPDHQGALALMGSPRTDEYYFSVNGPESAGLYKDTRNIFDTSLKWTSKFFDNKTQVDAVIGYHHDKLQNDPGTDDGSGPQFLFERLGAQGTASPARSLTEFEAFEPGGVPDECMDGGPDDPYPGIINCPATNYRFGGVGYRESTKARRLSGILSVTQRVQAAGHHVIKGGVDVEDQFFDSSRIYSGGTWFRERPSASLGYTYQLYSLFNRVPMDTANARECDLNFDGVIEPSEYCLAGDPTVASAETRNQAAFLQDSWSILPNLTVNGGLRYERQRLMAADEIVGNIDPATGKKIPETAFVLDGNWAPRVGVIYDPTKEGRSRIYGHYGRFYESIPMDIQIRAYGGELLNIDQFGPDACTLGANSLDCDPDAETIFNGSFGGGGTLFAPGLKSQYVDDIVVGGEYEVLADTKVGLSYIRRDLGRAMEDLSTDAGTTYYIANPGMHDEDAIHDMRVRAADPMTSPEEAAQLQYEADLYENSTFLFDTPTRTYNAIQLTGERRFTKSFFVTASYTYSKLRGNFPGLFSPETLQDDPNLTSMYDLPDLMGNRYGDLAQDRPHNFKLDGYYSLPVEGVGDFVFGGRARAISGRPISTLGSGYVPGYTRGEVYMLPRGETGRTGLTTRFDTHLAYGRALSDGMKLEAFVDIFNIFNQQPETEVEEEYTLDAVNPIIGGDSEDLRHAKSFGGDALPSNASPTVNPNFKNTTTRQLPLSARFGLRLIF
jgi:outer membrane receptor protein involved in Fe transport